MKLLKKILIGAGIISALWAGVAIAAPFLPASGGTGNGTGPTKGDLLVGSSTTAYARVAVGTDGNVLTASSGAQYGIIWAAVPAVTTINGAPAQFTFTPVFSGNIFTIATTTSGGSSTVTFTIPKNLSAFTNDGGFITGNQSITFTAGGDISGSGSGATSISPTLTVNGLKGSALPSLATGTLQYINGWQLNNVTSSLVFANATGTYITYAGTNCSAGQAPTTLSTAGVFSGCTAYLTGNQTITLTGAVTGSGATNIATTYTTSTLYGFFSGTSPITFDTSTGVIACATCLTGNQSITFIAAGDATGTASGATSITDTMTITGLQGKALPALATGTLQYISGAWALNNATSALGLYDANGKVSSYAGNGPCSAGQFANQISATGVLTCATPAAGGSPGGSDTQVQWNNGGAFQGDANFTYTSSTPKLSLGSSTSVLTIGTSTNITNGVFLIETSTVPMLSVVKNGNIAIATTTNTARLTIQTQGNTLSTNGVQIYDSGGKAIMNIQNDGDVSIGAIGSPNNNSRVYAFGGANGANFDARGDKTVLDSSVYEAEGSDYDTNVDSVRIQMYGASSTFGSTLGFTNTSLGALIYSATVAGIIDTSCSATNSCPIVIGVNDQEAVRITNGGNVGIGTSAPSGILDLTGPMNFQQITAVGTSNNLVPANAVAGGSCTAGSHSWKVTFVNAFGETTPGPASTAKSCSAGSNKTIPLNFIPTGPNGTTQRKIYRTIAGNTGSWLLDQTIADNTTISVNDTVADGSLGAAAPSSNTTLVGQINVGGTNAITIDSTQRVGIGTTAPSSLLQVNGTFQLSSSSTVTTASISGAIVGLGCDTATSSVDSTITSSTAAFVTTPTVFPGQGLFWQTYLSAPGVITTEVCSDVTVTPTASTYIVKIIK